MNSGDMMERKYSVESKRSGLLGDLVEGEMLHKNEETNLGSFV